MRWMKQMRRNAGINYSSPVALEFINSLLVSPFSNLELLRICPSRRSSWNHSLMNTPLKTRISMAIDSRAVVVVQ